MFADGPWRTIVTRMLYYSAQTKFESNSHSFRKTCREVRARKIQSLVSFENLPKWSRHNVVSGGLERFPIERDQSWPRQWVHAYWDACDYQCAEFIGPRRTGVDYSYQCTLVEGLRNFELASPVFVPHRRGNIATFSRTWSNVIGFISLNNLYSCARCDWHL